MKAAPHAAWAAVTRRRLQTTVTAAVALLATTTAVLALGLLVASFGPFDRAFSDQRGAHATVGIDPAKAAPEQIRAATGNPRITAVGGPYPETSVEPTIAGSVRRGAPPISVVGRDDPDGSVDRSTLRSGRWVRAPGEVVLSRAFARTATPRSGDGIAVGGVITLNGRDFTVVGIAASITGTADAWVRPGEVASLAGPDRAPTYQVLYRFAHAGDAEAIRAGMADVRATLPADAVMGSSSWLEARRQSAETAALVVPFVTAFAVLGLVMAVLIVANVVSGAVVAGYRGIGILKTLGFTPGQVTAVYVLQVLLPALVGVAVGMVAGHLVATPLLADTADSYDLPQATGVPLWVDVAVPLGVAAIVGATALASAVRAGRVSAIRAIAMGRAPRAGRGFRAQRLLARAPLPRAVGLGLAGPFARPARSAMTLAALFLGTAAVTFAYGLGITLTRAEHGLARTGSAQVEVGLAVRQAADPSAPPGQAPPGSPASPLGGAGDPSTAPHVRADPAAIAAALRADPRTDRITAFSREQVRVPGRSDPIEAVGYDTDSAWIGYPLVAGRWFSGAGEAVVPTPLLRDAALGIGDSLTLEVDGRRTTLRIVGEAFSSDSDQVLTDRGTLAALSAEPHIDGYEVRVKPGTDVAAYTESVGATAVFADALVMPRDDDSSTIDVMLGLIATLTLFLAAVAGLGVLNTVVLDTRERAQAMGVLKCLGMTPRQTTVMVLTSVAGLAVVGGLAGLPLGAVLHHTVAPAIAGTAQLRLPDAMLTVYSLPMYALLAAAGLVPAALGAAIPAIRAARARASGVRTE
jgi:putative ABC transport system permease protein